jgi:hypothetical protein
MGVSCLFSVVISFLNLYTIRRYPEYHIYRSITKKSTEYKYFRHYTKLLKIKNVITHTYYRNRCPLDLILLPSSIWHQAVPSPHNITNFLNYRYNCHRLIYSRITVFKIFLGGNSLIVVLTDNE